MKFQTNGYDGITLWKRRWIRLTALLKPIFNHQICLNIDSNRAIYFQAESINDFFRPSTMFNKEPGTIQWIKKEFKDSEVFYDIGANIGIYSLLAAKLNPNLKVYSFEPHAINFSTLLKNILLNNFLKQITPLSCALSDRQDAIEFNYYKMDSGTTASQLGSDGYDDFKFNPVASELKYCVSIDHLIEIGRIPPADHIKIDVDGIELKILQGMKTLLKNGIPKSVQVEVNLSDRDSIFQFMSECDYRLDHKHYTKEGQRKLEAHFDESKIPYNAVFKRGKEEKNV